MLKTFLRLYEAVTLHNPWVVALLLAIFTGTSAYFAQNFRLDASADSLLLESDQDLEYFRQTVKRYGANDFFAVTYRPDHEIFSDQGLQKLKQLKDELNNLDGVQSVVSILDVPLIASPPVTIAEVQKETRTLLTPGMDLQMAKRELLTSPLYKQLLLDKEAKITVLQVNLPREVEYFNQLNKRNDLQQKKLKSGLSAEEELELIKATQAFDLQNAAYQARTQNMVSRVREVLDRHRGHAEIFLGGVPLIASDMTDFVRSDISTFGIGIALFIVVLLALAFHRVRWVLIPGAICVIATVGMTGTLGFMDWPITVVSSNFISLALIITLSLVIHLIVRYRELHLVDPEACQKTIIRETLRSKLLPSIFTAITTIVSFASLVVSDIKPVIDFGLMMVWGVSIAFAVTFLLFPAGLSTLAPGHPEKSQRDFTRPFIELLSKLVRGRKLTVILLFALMLCVMSAGILRLTVENRFIDYFKSSTEIYQGMHLIDTQLGGTTPLDIILDAEADFFEEEDDEFALEGVGLTGSSYWFNSFQLEEVTRIHDYLEALPETGKVLSMATTIAMMQQLNGNEPLDDFSLAIVERRLPDEVKQQLFSPYMSSDGNQVRFSARIIDSADNLNRAELLKKIRQDLETEFDLAPEQIHLTSMLVLYNNVLQSLFQSQILTLGVVFAAIFAMLCLLFRSFKQAFLGTVPTLFAASFILGLMGWLGIPLDIMTITIAAITIGIGVDNAIHYIHRFREEFSVDRDYDAAMQRSHCSVGQAIVYTAITISIGFSILALSNFIPSIYFGLLTGLAMLIAMLANLTLLPAMLIKAKAFGKN